MGPGMAVAQRRAAHHSCLYQHRNMRNSCARRRACGRPAGAWARADAHSMHGGRRKGRPGGAAAPVRLLGGPSWSQQQQLGQLLLFIRQAAAANEAIEIVKQPLHASRTSIRVSASCAYGSSAGRCGRLGGPGRQHGANLGSLSEASSGHSRGLGRESGDPRPCRAPPREGTKHTSPGLA